MNAFRRIARVFTRRRDFKAREGNLDAVVSASYDSTRTRVSRADMDRPEGMGRRHVWPPPVPRSMQGQELDYEE